MKNFEKYEEEIKELNYKFGFDYDKRKILKCSTTNCLKCLFGYNGLCYMGVDAIKIEWLYEVYNPKTQLTVKEIEELLKDKYPNGIEVID